MDYFKKGNISEDDATAEKSNTPEKDDFAEKERINEKTAEDKEMQYLGASLEGGDIQRVEQPAETDGSEDMSNYCGPRCVRCGNPVLAGTDYCEKCKFETEKAPLRAGGVFAAIVMIIMSVFATAFMVLSLDIYSNVIKGDLNVMESNYVSALKNYNEANKSVAKVNTEINKMIESKEALMFFSTGRATVCKTINATSVSSGTIRAGELIEQHFKDKKIPLAIKQVNEEYNKIKPTYMAIAAIYSEYYGEYYQSMQYGMKFEGEISFEKFNEKLAEACAKNPNYVQYMVEYFRFAGATITESTEVQLEKILKVKELAPEEHWLYCAELMQLYLDMEKYDDLIEIADIAIKNNYDSQNAYLSKAEALFRSERYEECIKTAETEIGIFGDGAATNVYKIRALYQMDKKDEAFKACESLNNEDGSNSSYYAMKAELYRRNKEYEKAIATCEDGLKVNEEDLELFRQKAIVYMLQGDKESAKTALESANNIGISVELAYTISIYSTLANDTKWYKEIEELLTQNRLSLPEIVKNYVDKKTSLEDIFISGKGDVV